MSAYNLTIIRPQNFLHSSGFIEVRESLGWALTELGHVANSSENYLSMDSGVANIIFGSEFLGDEQQFPPGTIIYNLEQPTHPNMNKIYWMARNHGLKLWDCFASNVQILRKEGVEAFHVPIGYTPNLTRIPDQTQDPRAEVLDVLFYGWLTPRRKDVIRRLRNADLNVYAANALYGGGRDSLISRAKIVLNVHHDDQNLFEMVRVSYLMANSKCVVSEISQDDDQYADIHDGFIRVPYEQLVPKCQEVVANKSFIDMPALDAIRKRDYVCSVKQALN